jgi:MraZ protein
LNSQAKRLQRLLLGHATECELDGQGRFLVPEPLRRFATLQKKVAMVGQGNKFEIWDDETWRQARELWIEVERSNTEGLSPELESLSF